eukprot:TRINITY_DN12155_c0_g1_i1.p1 TRINITY_DN12155_c0_g1~~TRINITY_DN12155_c0_g1_i1.p1  ORF type:complete len:228 (+),score=80.07 TRINITY_DN12155_c0_g1_i1:9-692(+)
MDSEECAEIREMEIESLEAIFNEDFYQNEDGIYYIRMLGDPYLDETENNVGILMEFTYPDGYPNTLPTFRLSSIKGVNSANISNLQNLMKEEGENCIGEQMIYMMTSIISDWLDNNNADADEVVHEKDDDVKDEFMDDGIPVTVETFKEWWAGFVEEMKQTKVVKEVKRAKGGGPRLTGREVFMQMGEELTEIEEEIDDTEVDWEVFEAENVEDLDDLTLSSSEESN